MPDPSLAVALPAPLPRASGSRGPHCQVSVPIVVENGPQLKLLKAADRDRKAQVHVELPEDADTRGRGDTQAWGRDRDGEMSRRQATGRAGQKEDT